MTEQRESYRKLANAEAFEYMSGSEPVLIDVQEALAVVPGMTRETILTSGAPLPWDAYMGGQRDAILGAAVFEGLAENAAEAEAGIRTGAIQLHPCHDHGCVGSMSGVYTASMPVFVVENRTRGNRGFCSIYEGPYRERLTYGIYNETVHRNLLFIRNVVGPVLREAVQRSGGLPLLPIMTRGLHMGDELHSRNTAATLLFSRALLPHLMAVAQTQPAAVDQVVEFLGRSDLFFLHLGMAAAKVAADAAHAVEGASLVTAMTLSCREFAIRVSGLGQEWFRAGIPPVEGRLFAGYCPEDIGYIGGESLINETVGVGGFAQAAAFALQAYSGGSAQQMVENTLSMYEITVGEHPGFQIPYLGFRGTPAGIDIHRVTASGICPIIDLGVAHKAGGQIGAGVMRAPLACFQAAVGAYGERYRIQESGA